MICSRKKLKTSVDFILFLFFHSKSKKKGRRSFSLSKEWKNAKNVRTSYAVEEFAKVTAMFRHNGCKLDVSFFSINYRDKNWPSRNLTSAIRVRALSVSDLNAWFRDCRCYCNYTSLLTCLVSLVTLLHETSLRGLIFDQFTVIAVFRNSRRSGMCCMQTSKNKKNWNQTKWTSL